MPQNAFTTAAPLQAASLTWSAAGAQQSGRVPRVGHQRGWLSTLKGSGTLEKELAPLGVSVRWAI